METNPAPDYPNKQLDPDSSDRTLSTGAPGGAAAGQIGPYRLLQVIGEGGMGEVWLAEQKTPIHRTVALKLIKAGMDTKTVVARFESERQALALMDHPNIAQVYDAGSTPEKRPYFVMEYVPGLPITEYCDKHRLSMRERLELFQQVCDGVQHAHQKAIIHRDLKPSNILVVEQDNKSIPKIIDFGLAKAMAQRLTEKTIFTEMGVLVGTPEYMSPEQADMSEQSIDTRTDVYSLGVILYELLAGALPFDARTLRAAGLEAILRVIREVEPPKPSTKVRSLGNTSAATAEKRREEPRSFARHLQGELDWITLKALEKDRTRRYGTASELASDIERYLQDEPVTAGPATATYRIKKYAARHRFALATAALLVVLLAGFTVVQAVEIHRIRIERDRANRERDRANRVTDFMTGMFKVSDPSEAKGNSVTAREILDKASANIDTSLTKDPELQAQMMATMASVYNGLGLYSRSEQLDRDSLKIRQRVLGQENADTVETMTALAIAMDRAGHLAEAEKLNRKVLEIRQRLLGRQNPDTLDTMNNLGLDLTFEGQYAEAEKLDRETLETRERIFGPNNLDTAGSMNNLAIVLNREGRYAEAEKLDREALEIRRRVEGPEGRDTALSMSNLALRLDNQGRYAEAERLDRDALKIRVHVLGPEHPDTLQSMNNLSIVLGEEKHYSEAEMLARKTLEIKSRVLGPQHPDTLSSMNSLAVILNREGRFAQAEELDRRDLEMRRRVFGPQHPLTALIEYSLAGDLAPMKRRNEALSMLRQAVDDGLSPQLDLAMATNDTLTSLHGDPQFRALVAHANEVAAARQKAR